MKISRKIGIKRGLLGLILTSVVLGGFVVQAQFSRNAYVVNTVHLFPAQIDAEGWENYETLTFQNLDQYALLQEFNAINSATLREPGRRSTVESDDSVNQLKLQSVPAATSTTTTEPVSVSDGEIGATSTFGTSTSVQQNDMVPAATSTQVPDLSDEPEATGTVTTTPPSEVLFDIPAETQSEPSLDSNEMNDATETSTSTVLNRVNSFLRLAIRGFATIVQATTTATSSVVDEVITTQPEDVSSVREDIVSEEDDGQNITNATTSPTEPSTQEVVNTDDVVEEPIADTTVETGGSDEASTSTDIANQVDDDISTSTTPVSTTTNANIPQLDTAGPEDGFILTDNLLQDETVADSFVGCTENCEPHVITLNNFAHPLEEGVEISGAQLRVSMAAEKKMTRDRVPAVSIQYSVDGGASWSSAGSVLIEEEISNSINGGYFLFAMPQVVDQDTLNNLSVQIRYDDDMNIVQNLFVESAWVELFTLERPSEVPDTDIADLLADDGYREGILSGDVLTLPDGEQIEFTFTDNNDDETLIIKSDEVTYDGLTEAVTYFSVTNTTDRPDRFRVNAYFPDGVGTVNSLEMYNQNRPRDVIIPEYRPYVYHCNAGWSAVETVPDDLATLSQTLGTDATSSSNETAAYVDELITEANSLNLGATTSMATATSEGAIDADLIASVDTLLARDTTQSVSTDTNEQSSFSCADTSVIQQCDAIEADGTACIKDQVLVEEHAVVQYAPGWETVPYVGEGPDAPGLFSRVASFLGFGPELKEVPDSFEVRAHTPDEYVIQPGETKYFKMNIGFEAFTTGEYWIEAVGDREYGLLDPFWSSQWQYRLPISIDNTTSGETLTEHQVFLELDSTLTDFWSNVNSDGSDIRFIQETTTGNEEDWYGTGWGTRTPITIQASQIDENLTDFPVYVDLADLGSGFFNSVQGDGGDIRITESDGLTELPYELVSIDTTLNTGELHFLASSISSSTDTTFYIYHDNPNVSGYAPGDTFGALNVWGGEYIGVYHLEEDAAGRGNADLYQDSTTNNYDLDDELNSTGKTGLLGRGQEVAAQGDANEYILLPSDIVNGEDQLTFSYWLQSTETNNQALINGGADNDYLVFLTSGGNTLQLFDGGSVSEGLDLDVTPTPAAWRHVTVSRDALNNEWRIFIDGVEDSGGPIGRSMSALSLDPDCLVIGLEQDGSCLSSGDTSQHLNGLIDELRFRNDVPSAQEVSAQFRNQATTTDFYTVESAETFTVTSFSELDHWVQHFDYTTNEADIWVQVDTIAANASTTIYLYYGSPGAVSTSDEYAPFTYSSPRNLYYVVSDIQSSPIVVYSYIDNNEVSIDGGTPVVLNSGETTSFATYSSSSVISANGPITARTSDNGSEPPVPIGFATTSNIVTTNRASETFYVHAPSASAVVDIFEGGNTVETASGTVAVNTTDSFAVNIGGGDSGILEADAPVLLLHTDGNDSYVAYPPTLRAIFGVYSRNFNYASLGSTDVEIFCSDGTTSGTTTGMTRGIEEANDFCANGSQGTGDGVMIAGATAPIAATQEADGDGNESSRFLPEPEFGTRYLLPQTAEYITVVCSPRFGTSTIEIQTSGGTLIDSATCGAGAGFPGVVHFTATGPYTQGTQVISTNQSPFYMYYEEASNNDETNTWGAVQARDFETLDSRTYSFGSQEINIDAEYNQLAYRWYENVNGETPTTPWQLGDDGDIAENQAIVGQGSVNIGDVLRLRMSVQANTATGSVNSTAFALQYTEATTCSTANNWQEIGLVGSTTAAWSGFNNSTLDDGVSLTSTVLASSTVFGTYEEASLSAFLVNEIPTGAVAEFDWVITNSNADANTSYCFRMVRSSGDALVSYTNYAQANTSGPPDAATLLKRFNNEHATSLRPTLEFVASDLSGDDLHYYVEIDDDRSFGSPVLAQNSDTHFDRFTNVSVPSNKAPFNSGQIIRYTPPSDLTSSTTYWWRVRSIDPTGSNTFSVWSEPFSFTVNESLTVSEWFQTTDEQFETNSLSTATTTGSGSIEPAIGGSTLVGEYGSLDVNVGSSTTVSLNNSYTNPVVVTSIRYARSVPNGDQPITRVSNKTSTSFDVLAYTFDFTSVGTATVDYIVMEAGEALIDNGGSGLRVFATSTSVGAIAGSAIPTDPGGVDITFPTAFSSAPTVLAAVTTDNDPSWVAATVYDGNDISNPPTASQVSLYLNDSLASDGHTSAEDIDIIAFDTGAGSNNGVNFATQITAVDVTDTPIAKTYATTYSSTPGVILVQQRTMNGNQGGYAMIDIDTPPTNTQVTVAFEEGGTAGARGHTSESLSIVSFEGSGGNILRAGNAVVVSTPIDFDDADVGNAWGEVDWNDAGSNTFQVQYQTGSGFALIPDSALPGNSTGFSSGPINILSLDTATYNELRLVATLGGVNPELFDWRVTWGQRVNIPELGDPYDNQKVSTTTPTFDFTTTDPQGDTLEYEISWSTDKSFATGSTTRNSGSSSDFNGSSPYPSGDTVTFTIPTGDALANGQTYWWRVRARDPLGSNSWSPWSEPDSFTIDTTVVVSTWFQTTQGQFDEGVFDGAFASTSDSISISSEIGEYGTTTVTGNSWVTISTELTYNNMVVVASPRYSFNGSDNGRSVMVRNKTSDSFEIKAENYTESLSGVTDIDYIVMEAGNWIISDGGTGTRFVAGTAEDVSEVEGSGGLGYEGGRIVDFSPDFTTTPAVLATISSDNNGKWTSVTVDDGTAGGEVGTAEMYLAMGVSLDPDQVRSVPEDIDYIAFETGVGDNNSVLFDAFNTGVSGSDGITESETESVTTFNQTFSTAPGVVVVKMNGTNGGDGGTAQVDTDEVVTATDIGLSIAEHGPTAGNHADENVSVLAFESGGGTIVRESSLSGGLVGTAASEPILFSDGNGPKFAQAIIASTTPGNSSTTIQIQYLSGSGVWLPIPDSQIPGNSVGTTTSPIGLSDVDVSIYDTIRIFATLQCDAADCPTVDDWSVEWSEGVPISGTLREYDRFTNVATGTVRVAVNGLAGNTGSVNPDGTWTIDNVTAFNGDVVTVWVDGAAEADEAVSVFVYDGVGDMTDIELYEQHLAISAAENATATNALLSSYDNSVSGDEDIFFDVDSNNDLVVCAVGDCESANLYIGPGNAYIPDSGNSGNFTTHDFINDGIVELGGNTIRVSGSWDNNAVISTTGSTVIFTATSTSETVDDSDGLLDFTNLTFGEGSTTATWQVQDPLDINGNLTVAEGTLNRSSLPITVSGNLTTGANGSWSGIGTTTFDGNSSAFWSDGTLESQNVGRVVVDGGPKTLILSSSVRAETITVAPGDTLNSGGSHTLNVEGDFTNNGTFLPQSSTVAIVGSSTVASVRAGSSALFNLTASSSAGNISIADPQITILGDLVIENGNLNLATVTTTVNGSFINNGGTFAHNNAEVRFTSAQSETIQLQGSSFLNHFYDVRFSGSGDWSFLDTNATTTNTFRITNGDVTFPAGVLSVGRDFTVSGAGSFAHNGGEVLFLTRANDTIRANGSDFNDVRIVAGDPIRDGGYSADWLYRDTITINSSQIDDDLTDFPVYLDLSDFSSDFFANINSDGGDIRITTSDGVTEVPREIVSASTTAETGEVYFQAPTLSSTTDTIFYIYYGNATATDYAVDDPFGAENVWDDDFLAVYHMEAMDPVDSTSFNRDTSAVGDTPTVAAGLLGNALDLENNGGADYLDLQSNLSELDGASEMTVSAWVNVESDGSDNVFYTRGNGNSAPGLVWKNISGNDANDTFTFNDGNTGDQGNRVDALPTGIAVGGTWQYVVGAMQGADRYIYVDGAIANTDTTGDTTIAANTQGASIGYWSGSGGFDYDGLIDEWRLSRIERSASWIAAEYRNMATSTDFYTVSSGSSGETRIFAETNTTVSGDLTITGAQTQFPSGTLNVGGSFDNDGVFVAGSGLVNFNSASGTETIAVGTSSSFYDVAFDSSGGEWTITENATATNNINLVEATSFTVAPGITLESTNTFTNSMANAATTWTGATLLLSSGADVVLNAKDSDGDDYGTLTVVQDAVARMWNSTATTYDTQDASAIYSQDHAGIDGDLYIFGEYVRETGTEYWTYATDFDGIDLTASSAERQVNVRVANGAMVTASSATLLIEGVPTASTTVDAQSGSFTLSTQSATLSAQHFTMTGTDANGFQLLSSTTVNALDNAEFTIPNSASAVTVDATTIDTNPESQFFNTSFVSGGGNVNVTLSGSPASFWWFRNGAGDRYGEAFDNADGNPGSIQWDDSNFVINISGTVYADDGVTSLGGPTCDGSTPNVRVRVDGTAYTDTVACDGVTGAYSFTNVSYNGDANIIVYLDTDGGDAGTVITRTPTGDITDMDIYANRVITRHENTATLSIADMAIFDNADDSDIQYTAATSSSPDSLTILSGSGLYVWDAMTFEPNGTIDLQGVGVTTADGSLTLGTGAVLQSTSTNAITIGGSLLLETGAAFNGASSTVTFDSTNAGQEIGSAASSTITFEDIVFDGSGGEWAVQTPIVSRTGITLTNGTVTGVSDITVESGSFSGAGSVNMTGGTVTIERDNTLGGINGWTFNNLVLGDGSTIGVTTPGSNATTTIDGQLTIAAGHFLDAGASAWNLTGSGSVFVENGTFQEGTSVVRYSGLTPNVTRTAYYNLEVDNELGGTVNATAPSVGLQVTNDFTVGRFGTATLNLNANDPVFGVAGDLYIGAGGTIDASDTAAIQSFGNWDNDGSFIANGGEVRFLNTGSTVTVAAGSSAFGDVSVTGVGAYEFTESATSTGDFTLAAGDFSLSSGQTLAVGGAFTNEMNGANTTWTGSTLRLYSGTAYSINDKTRSDTYETISTGPDTHVRLWNSTATSFITDGTSSIYSQDHAGVDGNLSIYGDFVSDSFNDHWSYAADFDGASLVGSERQANVLIEDGGSVRYEDGSLSVMGASTASTTIAAMGGGSYAMTVGGSTNVFMNYYVIRDTDTNGLVFSGVPDVSDLSYGDFLVEAPGGSTMTVGGSVINANQARNFTDLIMATSSAISAFNVTATGTSVSSWRFVNVDGNLDGEALDVDPGGDPGYLVWEDSAAIIDISGTVYSDDGVTPMGASVCDGTTNNIRLSIQGLTFASTSCAVGTGVYTFTGIGYGPSDTLTVYIDNEPENAVTVTQDPISSIGNMDLYQNRVIVRHESGAPLTIADMGVWDSDDDADILFDVETAGGDTLVLPANTELVVWTDKEFAPGGDVTVSGGGAGASFDGSLVLQSDAIFTASTTEAHSIGGSLNAASGAIFTPASSTVTFTTSGSGRTIDTNNGGFNNVIFNGTGSWNVVDTSPSITADLTITNGAVTLPAAATTTIGGSFENTGGSFVANNGLLYFTASDSGNVVRLGGSAAHRVTFEGAGGSWSISDVNATTSAAFTVASGTVTLPSGTLEVVGDFIVNDTIDANNGTLLLASSAGANEIRLNNNDLSSVQIAAGTGDYTFAEADATLLNDFTVTSGTVTVGTGTLAIGGSFDIAGGTFNNSNGTVLFNAGSTGETITTGANDLYNAVLSNPSGGWTIVGNATTTNNFSLQNATQFTLSGGSTLYVGGVFSNDVGGSATTWLGSTLILDSGTEYEISSKTIANEQYDILEIGANTDISSWNSQASSTVVDPTGSWYSQDHSSVDGSLYIYGDYRISTTTEYWSFDTDFDGVALAGGARAVAVEIASGSSVTIDGGVLNMIGDASGTTTVGVQGSGTYSFAATSGTLQASHYQFRDLGATGLNLSGGANVVSLSNGDYEQATDSATLITVTDQVINNNAGLVISNTRFATGGNVAGTNVSLNATTTNSWTFTGDIGDLWGEAFDIDGTDACSSLRWDDSDCLLTEQSDYRWRNDDGGEGGIDATWFDTNWDKRKRIRIINNDATTYSDVAVKLDISHEASMQSDFEDLRFTDASGTTTIGHWIERFTAGIEADVWVVVDSLPANSAAEVYMYYDNVAATSTSDSSTVFTAADDFDDNNISEYSGDTTLFATGGTYAFSGNFGLDASPDTEARATEGIARTDLTVSQGDIIRYMQYVDTVSGSGDEVCTMFGVQSTSNISDNYAVCLSPLRDRVSIVEDVVDTDSSGTRLASSSISLATGWYEVEIDWQTNGDIDVTVFDDAGSVAATTTANDTTYSSGGIGFTFWFQHGGWDSYVAWPRTNTRPTPRIGAEQSRGGATWAALQNTPGSGFLIDETARLRIGIDNSGLDITNQNFQLEFAPKGTALTCAAVPSGDYDPVPVAASCGSSEICMTTSSSTSNGDPTTDHLLNTAGEFVAGQIVADTANQTSAIDLNQGEYTEIEYALRLTSNATNDAFCFRVTDAGAALDSYANLPELNLQFDPVLDPVSLNGGQDITLSIGTTTTVVASTTVTDFNGFADLTAATTTFYTTSATAACTPDDNNCYIATSTCSFTNCSGSSCTLSCSADFAFHTDPTDNNVDEWFAFMDVGDSGGATDFDTSTGVEVLTLLALDVQDTINYGALDINENTGSFNPEVDIRNQGNDAIDVRVSGSDMSDGVVSIIPASQQIFSTSTFTYDTCVSCNTLNPLGTDVELDLAKPVAATPPVEDQIYWGIEVPFGTASNPHTGFNTFTVIPD